MVLLASFPLSATAAEQKLTLTPKMLLNESAIGDSAGLVDEQEAVGDPANGKGKPPSHPFFPGWAAWQYPISVVIDLGAANRVTRLCIYNETGRNNIVVSYGKPFAWKDQPVTLDGFRSWKEVLLGVETRYLRLTLLHPAYLPEIVAYGEPQASPAPPPAKTIVRRPLSTIDQLIGMNAFIDDPIDAMAGAGAFVREYHSWGWDVEGKDGLRRFQPSGAAGGNSWFFDDYYAKLKARGVTVSPALQQMLPAVFGGKNEEAKPIAAGKDAEAPASYAIHAAHMFQYAARYGSRKVEDSLLDLAPGQPRKSGLGLLRYIENWNEPDKTWRDREGLFKPYELAAMCSADYDGDQGRMGKAFGVKTADPRMRMAIGGLAGLSLEYLRAMKFWTDFHRNGDFPADVLNLHHYCSNGNEQGFLPNGHGISPEDDHLREKMAEIVAWRNKALPDREVWLTEYGYDTNPGSPLHAPVIGTLSAEQVQGIWLVRSVLALAAAGVDRSAMFMLRDVDSKGAGVFATCGLVTEKGQWQPKPAWYFLATMKKRLAGMCFAQEMPTGRKDVCVFRFTAEKGKSEAYAVWCPTSEDKHVGGFKLRVGRSGAGLVALKDKMAGGAVSTLAVTNGTVTLDVSETPVFVLVGE